MIPAIELVNRRLPLVDTSDPNACYEWPGPRARGGYGIVGGNRAKKIPPYRVNRVVLEAKLGRPIGLGLRALHTCDWPPCFNENHLYGGTQKRNLADARDRGRIARGSRNARAVLTEAQVLAVRSDPRSTRELATLHGVHAETIRRARNGQRWAHLPIGGQP